MLPRHPLRPLLLLAALVASLAPSLAAQMLGGRESAQLMRRMSDLMEATRIVMPELARAGEPLAENFRQGSITLETSPSRDHTGILYSMLTNAKAYLQLADMMPRPDDFSEEVASQISELRNSIQRMDSHFRATLNARELQALGSDRDNLGRYAEENRRVDPTNDAVQRVVFLGDSITDGWELNQFFISKPYINRGISGQITGQMLGRIKSDVIDLRPTAVVVLGGTNDLARGVPDSTIRSNLESIGMLAEAAGVKPVMASILPVNDYHADNGPRFMRSRFRSPNRIWELNRWLVQVCEKRGWHYLDYYSALADTDNRLRKDLSDDGLHPNTEGYKVMAPLAQAALEAVLVSDERRSRTGPLRWLPLP